MFWTWRKYLDQEGEPDSTLPLRMPMTKVLAVDRFAETALVVKLIRVLRLMRVNVLVRSRFTGLLGV